MNKLIVIATLTAALALTTGCATAPMTAKSRLVVSGEAVVLVEKTTTRADGSTEKVVDKTTKSPAAAELELKLAEIDGRTKVGVAKAEGGTTVLIPTTRGYGTGGSYWQPQHIHTESCRQKKKEEKKN